MNPEFYSLQMNAEATLNGGTTDVWSVLVLATLAHLADEENQ